MWSMTVIVVSKVLKTPSDSRSIADPSRMEAVGSHCGGVKPLFDVVSGRIIITSRTSQESAA